MYRILVVEDEDAIRDLITLNLAMVGYKPAESDDGIKARERLQREDFDLCILDLMLPGMDGYELMPYLLGKNIPVIMLTAKDRLSDRVNGLNIGADDYLVKPFETVELLARVRAILRRAGKQNKVHTFENTEVYPQEHRVLKNGQEVELTPREFDLLLFLLENKGIALSRETILARIWEYAYEGNTRTVDIHIQRLRKKLNTSCIKTVYKMGYRLED
ncbi:MAG: response regulator transcription factor [Bacillota bacterium]|nr:response regulator transcription factor [Bacillota bacterium]